MIDIEPVNELVNSKQSVRVRLCDCLSGDIIHASLCQGPLYVKIIGKAAVLIPILVVDGEARQLVGKTNSRYKYGINYQMWVDKKVIIN